MYFLTRDLGVNTVGGVMRNSALISNIAFRVQLDILYIYTVPILKSRELTIIYQIISSSERK